MAAESSVITGRLPALLAPVCAPSVPVALPPACTAHIARPLRRHPSAPRRSMMAPSLGFRVRRRSAREHPLLGPQVAVAARRHRRRCRLAEGCSGRGRPAVRPHRGRWVEEAAAALRPPQPPLAAPSAPLALRRSTLDPRQPRGRPDADRRASLSQPVARL